ncbi:MAG: NlpC/P60 family protein [Desulfosporosinus sp.]|jgi:cell wall-associated NlpC family hydrolase
MIKMRFLHRTTLTIIIGVIFSISTAIPVQADNLQQQLNQSKQQVDQLNKALKVQKDKVASVTPQVMALRQSVEALNNSIARGQLLLKQEQRNFKVLEEEQTKLEKQRQDYIDNLGQFLKSNYEEGISSYLALLFEADSLSDFIDRVDKIKMIVDNYSKLQKDIVKINENLNNQKGLIKQKQEKIQASIEENNQTQKAVQQTLDKQQAILNQLSKDEKAALNAALAAQANVNRIQRLIEQEKLEAAYAAQEKSNPSSGASRGAKSVKGVSGTVKVPGGAQQILNFAAQFLGTPYVWGGTTPSGFDCSGFVQYVYRNNGISLSRTSEQQFKNGVSVSRSELRPGDLVFFHTYSSGASHVGIYVGNNTMIHSSSGGVTYDDMTNSYYAVRYLGARRVLAS